MSWSVLLGAGTWPWESVGSVDDSIKTLFHCCSQNRPPKSVSVIFLDLTFETLDASERTQEHSGFLCGFRASVASRAQLWSSSKCFCRGICQKQGFKEN